ncbi:hypothetical protein J1N35_002150 [Gossypium stocksii]|uniref:Ku70/Ku80 N-terminal alpha/beta domain-containing protein n=1 Tax=Gossypium stocksii TaxID=47602 RepID=A0A9D4AM36_9ROSI|nr:hypothetical protein J1N35_002150 [Gossypium stocksii]
MDLDPEDVFKDEEDDPDNEFFQQSESSKEYVVYLVDASPKMLNTTCPGNDQKDETHFHTAVSCIAGSLKTQIISRSYDEVAICFFNTVRCNSSPLGMGFSEEMVVKVVQENGEGNTDSILETLLTYSALETTAPVQQNPDSGNCSSDYEWSLLNDFSDFDRCYSSATDDYEIMSPNSEEGRKLLHLAKMRYPEAEASVAMERCDWKI